MQAVVCIKWKCTSTAQEFRFIVYDFDFSQHYCWIQNLIADLIKNRWHLMHRVCVYLPVSLHILVFVHQTLELYSCTTVGDHGCSQHHAAFGIPSSLHHEENSCFRSMSGFELRPHGSTLSVFLSLCVIMQAFILSMHCSYPFLKVFSIFENIKL